MMTVGELKEILKDLPDDLLVVIQKDPEGNGYFPARGVDDGPLGYLPEDYGFECVKYISLTPELKAKGYEEEDVIQQGETYSKCIVIFP